MRPTHTERPPTVCAECEVRSAVRQAGELAGLARYPLIKELLKRPELESMQRNTISKHLFFFISPVFSNSTPNF